MGGGGGGGRAWCIYANIKGVFVDGIHGAPNN